MKTISKKDIRKSVEEAMNKKIAELNIASPSKKTRNLVKKASKKISGRVKQDIRLQTKKTAKKIKSEKKASASNGRKNKKATSKVPTVNV
jgi:hypothetical protein